jgi:hypothetical protein
VTGEEPRAASRCVAARRGEGFLPSLSRSLHLGAPGGRGPVRVMGSAGRGGFGGASSFNRGGVAGLVEGRA